MTWLSPILGPIVKPRTMRLSPEKREYIRNYMRKRRAAGKAMMHRTKRG